MRNQKKKCRLLQFHVYDNFKQMANFSRIKTIPNLLFLYLDNIFVNFVDCDKVELIESGLSDHKALIYVCNSMHFVIVLYLFMFKKKQKLHKDK